jgi:hypothetical protein
MAGWSDAVPVSGTLLTHLLDLLRPLVPENGRVLVAGPHDASLVDTLAAYAEVTCLVRSQSDAAELTARGRSVLCGTLAKLTDTDQYDLVVALDGVGRLCSVEGPQYDWAESVQALRRALRPGGALLLAVENELGVHRLVDRTTATFGHAESDWYPAGEFAVKPANPARLEAQLTRDGLHLGWFGAAWPLPAAPTFVATSDMLRDGPAGALSAAVSAAAAAAYAGQPVLSDPRRLAAAAVRAGLGTELAPAWLVLAFRGPAPATGLPPVLTAVGPATELPTGRLVEELLIGACLRHDLPALRRVLTAWAASQPGTGFDNLLLDGETFRVLDPGRGGAEPAVVLRRFAHLLLTGGYHQPWPAADEAALTTILLAVAGLDGAAPADLAGSPAVPDPLPAPDSLREHEEHVRRLEQRLADAATRIEYVEAELVRRDAELRKARLQIDAFSGKVGYRITKLSARAARKAVRAVRPLFKD